MDLPLLGLALDYADFAPLRDWIMGPGRAVEIQDFVTPAAVTGDWRPKAAAWARALAGHTGEIGIHGPFFGLDIANPDPELRAVITTRLLQGLEIAEALGGTHMVVHSPFTYWHVLNRRNYPDIHGQMLAAAAECLAPVLARADGIGCTLMLENIEDADPADRRALVETINHPNLRLSIDTGHAELAHGRYNAPPPVDFISDAGALLGHVHLQDADGHADRHWHPLEGRIHWAPVMAALARLPVPPRLIIEPRDRYALIPQTVARMQALGLGC
ncbi:sugar phosphate isomerase/epimerase family protein [Phaeovulum sp. W22_SRMD_FR3]|uniref:sugar phosphate isomerase/epimerase family protein n=1 Tax=Phaeovulum sp. W22_SRMD_FR3 TaxID=3240274 RepID=UPI003F99F05F